MSEGRASDLTIVLGHALQCEECRLRLLQDPERVLIGRKVSAEQRKKLLALTPESFESTITLAAAVDMKPAELLDGIDNARARLRHL